MHEKLKEEVRLLQSYIVGVIDKQETMALWDAFALEFSTLDPYISIGWSTPNIYSINVDNKRQVTQVLRWLAQQGQTQRVRPSLTGISWTYYLTNIHLYIFFRDTECKQVKVGEKIVEIMEIQCPE